MNVLVSTEFMGFMTNVRIPYVLFKKKNNLVKQTFIALICKKYNICIQLECKLISS